MLFVFLIAISCLFFFARVEGELPSEVKAFLHIPEKEKSLSIVFFGDTMLDRNVRLIGKRNGYDSLFAPVKDFVTSFDLAVLNLEGTVTGNESLSLKDKNILRFTFESIALDAVFNTGFDIVSLSNNHTSDFGREGFLETTKNLEARNLKYFGDYFNESETLVVEKKGLKIAFVGFNEFAYKNFDQVLERIKKASNENDVVFVFAHFGEEYKDFGNSFQQKNARMFIDSGADAVIGAHPHVVQNIEIYKDKPIFYSLGNFVFDQYFSKQTQEGLAVSFEIKKKEDEKAVLSFKTIPFVSKASVPYLKIDN
ncbi:MAG: hypothetical protein QG585_301 [Patescibacteria group bacterium]|nr:hypothetical protein [Patescibacteria group bacterium]